jgi:hypothetical protein
MLQLLLAAALTILRKLNELTRKEVKVLATLADLNEAVAGVAAEVDRISTDVKKALMKIEQCSIGPDVQAHVDAMKAATEALDEASDALEAVVDTPVEPPMEPPMEPPPPEPTAPTPP